MQKIKRFKLNLKKVEKKAPNDIVGDVSFNIPFEILKFISFLIISVAFILLQYQNLIDQNNSITNVLRKIYLYSFGLAFGDLMILIIFGVLFTFIVRWLGFALKKYYFQWFKQYIRVDYFLLKKHILIFVWSMLLIAALIYHAILVSQRMENKWFYNAKEVSSLFTKGWIYSFSNQNNYSIVFPNASYNTGVFFDTIANLLYALAFSPYLMYLLIFFLFAFSIIKLITIKPLSFFKFLNEKRKNLVEIEQYLKKHNSIFYYSSAVKEYFAIIKRMAQKTNWDFINNSFYVTKKELAQYSEKTSDIEKLENKNKETISEAKISENRLNQNEQTNENLNIEIINQKSKGQVEIKNKISNNVKISHLDEKVNTKEEIVKIEPEDNNNVNWSIKELIETNEIKIKNNDTSRIESIKTLLETQEIEVNQEKDKNDEIEILNNEEKITEQIKEIDENWISPIIE
ncbi:hypothetical protein [Mycoplasmopsis columbina]|uniref:Transmembrane protein n=1 Tax=Mycoplasmopsis columbina SF7 TaxID=1037410 RepID=F9UJU6_9BACT|nr:hypothetical protein [Mycoplasmopsis columbina]EGV00292.1 hypothetical protein MCSF7_00764 [Mycoplasmopsis columbina SF7]VEU76844.1 Uncharacterised protein [Mycoplasmopsis columbina]